MRTRQDPVTTFEPHARATPNTESETSFERYTTATQTHRMHEGDELADFGICQNENCECSYMSAHIDLLFQRIAAVEHIEGQADIAGQLPFLKRFEKFFQFRQACAKCAGPLYFVTQPTVNLQPGSPEYLRISRLNALLDAGNKLRAWDILPPFRSQYSGTPMPGSVRIPCKKKDCAAAIESGFVFNVEEWITGFLSKEYTCPACNSTALYSREDVVLFPSKQ
jgi:hypothetical protein